MIDNMNNKIKFNINNRKIRMFVILLMTITMIPLSSSTATSSLTSSTLLKQRQRHDQNQQQQQQRSQQQQQQQRNNNGSIFATPIQKSSSSNRHNRNRHLEIFHAQQKHFHQRRLNYNKLINDNNNDNINNNHHHRHLSKLFMNWRQRPMVVDNNVDHSHSHLRMLQSDDHSLGTVVSSVPLSNCHLVLYSGTVMFGTPGQEFLVDFDTGSSDIWIPSKDCTCEAFPDWRKYNSAASSTYEIASDNDDLNKFDIQYEDGEAVHGRHAKDVLTMAGGLRVENQVFAQVTRVEDFTTCEAEEGVFGLGFSSISSHEYPTFLSNVLDVSDNSNLKHALFSLYLNPHDDYPDDNHHTYTHDADGNLEYGGKHPVSSNSQIVFGGVDQTHYTGCLKWHNLGQFEYADTGETFEGYWDFALERVLVGGTILSSVPLALVDSGSSYIVGPNNDVAQFAHINNAACFQLPSDDNPTGDGIVDPIQVDCLSVDGFDAAMIECDQPFFNLEFVADSTTYVLEKEDLIMRVDTSVGPACILRVVGTSGIPGWVLGDAFLNKYYAAFDFANRRVGFALATSNSQDQCQADLSLDITHVHEIQNGAIAAGDDGSGANGGNEGEEYTAPADYESTTTTINPEEQQQSQQAPAPTIPQATAPPTGRDPYATNVYTPENGGGGQGQGGPSTTETSQSSSSSSSSFQPAIHSESYGQIFILAILLGLGFTFLVSLVYKRKQEKQGEKFQEMVRRAEMGGAGRHVMTSPNGLSVSTSSMSSPGSNSSNGSPSSLSFDPEYATTTPRRNATPRTNPKSPLFGMMNFDEHEEYHHSALTNNHDHRSPRNHFSITGDDDEDMYDDEQFVINVQTLQKMN